MSDQRYRVVFRDKPTSQSFHETTLHASSSKEAETIFRKIHPDSEFISAEKQ